MDKPSIAILLLLILNILAFSYVRFQAASTPVLVSEAQTVASQQAKAPVLSQINNFIYISIFLVQGMVIAGLITAYLYAKKLSKDIGKMIATTCCLFLILLILMIVASNYPVI